MTAFLCTLMILFCICSVIFMYHTCVNCTERLRRLEKQIDKLNKFIER